MTLALFALLFVAAARLDLTPDPRTLSGRAVVNDGDTLTMAGERLRLKGIDAPEFDQSCRRGEADYACGREARDALRKLVAQGGVACEGWRRDRYRRLLVTCRAAGVEDVGARLVESGWAVAYGDYEAEERAARRAGAGLWAGSFARPSEWRAERGDMTESRHDLLQALLDWVRGVFRI